MIEVGMLMKQVFDSLPIDELQFVSGNLEYGDHQNKVWFPVKLIPYGRLVEYDCVLFTDKSRYTLYNDFIKATSIFGGITKYHFTQVDENNRPVKRYVVEFKILSSDDASDDVGSIIFQLHCSVCIKEISI